MQQQEEESKLELKELVDDLPLPPKLEESIHQLQALIQNLEQEKLNESLHVLAITNAAEELADQLKDLRFRKSVGSTQIIPNIVKAIEKIILFSLEPRKFIPNLPIGTLHQLLRIIGNLVHTADVNRRQFLDADGAQVLKFTIDSLLILEHRQNDDFQDEMKISVLVVTNLLLDYQPAIVALAETGLSASLSAVTKYAYSKRLHWMTLPLIPLEELVAIEAGWSQIPESFLCTLTQMILHLAGEVDMDEDESDSDILHILTVCTDLLATITEHARPSRFTDWLFVSCETDWSFSDGPPTPMWMRLLSFLRVDHFEKQAAGDICPEDHFSSLYSIIKAHIIRAMVVAVAYSRITPACSMQMMRILADWINLPVVFSERADLVTMIGLWLGNLACDEKSCRFLIEDCKILVPLIKIFQKWAPSFESQTDSSPVKYKPGEQAQVLHAWCGLARNLAVADTYKRRLGELGMVTYALECFRPEFDIVEPLNWTAAALLRHLCRNCADNVKRVLETNRINSVVNLARRAEKPHLMLEACRLLSVLTSMASQIDQSTSNGMEDKLKIIYSEETVDGLVRFAYVAVTSHHHLLINEALISLAILAVRPELTHALCSNLLKVQDSPGSDKKEEESSEKNKMPYRNSLEALLSIWSPSSESTEEDLNALNKKDSNPIETVQKDVSNDDDDENDDLIQILNKEASSSVGRNKNQNQTPIQMKENLKVVLIQLGNQSIKNKPKPKANSTDENNNETNYEDDFENNKLEIQKTLLDHFNSFHSKNQKLNLDHQAKQDPLDQQNQSQEEKDKIKISLGDSDEDLEKSKKIINGHNKADEINCQTDGGITESTNIDNNDNNNSSFSIIEVLKAWNI